MLSYATPGSGALKCIARFGNEIEAEFSAASLADAGIPARVLNSNTNSLGAGYGIMSSVELHVREQDAQAATEILATMSADQLEPCEEAGVAGADLVEAGAFQSARELYEAQTLLESARIESVLPAMAPRGNRPPGVGKRFILRVAPDDAERAREIFEQSAA